LDKTGMYLGVRLLKQSSGTNGYTLIETIEEDTRW